jgi:hypothetical protein
MVSRTKCLAKFGVLFLAVFLLLLSACAHPDVQIRPTNFNNQSIVLPSPPATPQVQTNGTAPAANYTFPNPPPPPPRRNTKIDSALRQLIQAQTERNLDKFLRQSGGFVVQNGSVLVTIDCATGQIEVAANATMNAGGVLASTLNQKTGFAAFVPITSLESLAADSSVLKIWNANPGVPE